MLVFLFVVIVGIFNIIVNFYDVFDIFNLLGINYLKFWKDNNDCLFKIIDIIWIKFVIVLFGLFRIK